MARTIGKRNIKSVQKFVQEKMDDKAYGEVLIPSAVFEKMMEHQEYSSMLDIWEGAYSEIERIVWDYMTRQRR